MADQKYLLGCTPSVDLAGLAEGGFRILKVLSRAPKALGFSMMVTCGMEGHGPEDPHSKGNALDIRTRDLSAQCVLALHHYLTQELGTAQFTVLYEVPVGERASIDPILQPFIYQGASSPSAEHLHVQVRKGTVYPPPTQTT